MKLFYHFVPFGGERVERDVIWGGVHEVIVDHELWAD